MKKLLSVVLSVIMILSVFTLIPFESSAASNPYPTSQTVGGVVTVPCTYYAWQQAYSRLGVSLPLWGNAIDWYNSAANAGYAVGSTACAESIACYSVDSHSYGHVAYVTSVSGSTMYVNEGGRTDKADNNGIVNGQSKPSTVGSNWYGSTLIGFIYLTHTHSYGAWQTVTEATCTTAGSRKRVCSCGDTQTETIDALGHSTVTDAAVAASCIKSGLTEGSHCSRCSTVIKAQESIPALGHDYKIVSTNIGCETVQIAYKCSRCGNEYSADSPDDTYSEWLDGKPQNIEESLIEKRYQYRTKEYTTSSNSSLAGWTKYDEKQDGWTDWSAWQNSSFSATSTRQVETQTVPAVTRTEYNYSRYLNSSAGIVGPWAGTWSGVYCGTYQERGWGARINNPDMSQGFAIYTDSRGGWFNETSRTVTDTAAYTQYRYRDAKYTYYYYRWSDYSEWTSAVVEPDDNTEVNIQYRYKIVPQGHTKSDWIIDRPAQPGVAGSKHKECTVCHTVLETESIPALQIIDENAPQVIVENKKATAGKTVEVKISLKNNPGIASMKLKLDLGSDLILTNVEFNNEIGGSFQRPQNYDSPILLNWYDGANNANGDFLFAMLTVKVDENAAAGEKCITVTYDPEDVYNISEQNISFVVTGGKIDVVKYEPGDINGDTAVNNKDLTRLFQYLSGWDVEVNTAALDVNGDGNSNNKDLTRLFQYLSGWDVEIY